jgi:hypothetical protein
LFSSEGSHAASFTDDTSLPHADLRVSINAQVIKEHRISWYFELLRLISSGTEEFKAEAVQKFFALPKLKQDMIFRTLGRVRIHITDARPYAASLSDILKLYLPKGTDVYGFLRRLDKGTKHLAGIRDMSHEFIAKNILYDSLAQRLLNRYRTWEYWSGNKLQITQDAQDGFGLTPIEPPSLPVDLTLFRGKNAISEIVNCVSASASVFSSAIDQLEDELNDYYFATPMAGPYALNNALNRAHAYDKGHSDRVEWIEQQRHGVLAESDPNGYFYPDHIPEKLIEVDSAKSPPIQAADIAASIARELWRQNSLVQVVRHFEYVTYNGERISEDKAAWCQRVIDEKL